MMQVGTDIALGKTTLTMRAGWHWDDLCILRIHVWDRAGLDGIIVLEFGLFGAYLAFTWMPY